jgi:hypothetical protein
VDVRAEAAAVDLTRTDADKFLCGVGQYRVGYDGGCCVDLMGEPGAQGVSVEVQARIAAPVSF